MSRTALVQVLGAVAYGEWKAHEGASAKAETAPDEGEREIWRRVAAEELRHYEGFVGRLRALGADPARAMRPYRRSLDTFHGAEPGRELEDAVGSYLGEGVAEDLLHWLRRVADADTAAFVDTVLADEEEHEGRAAAEIRALLGDDPGRRRAAARAAMRMVGRMVTSGGGSYGRFTAFLRVGRAHELLGALIAGHVRRLRAIGVAPARGLVPGT